ncbi:PDZ domain-containing protein [candidate division KSB3 bacterium]|uniref:PDZ domain-containing protein n=1 Tax=candidate division KSB3 bacterium TaxID=2044937 RepID=A0A9D5JRT5_9BACT|nr:PDZ domain-containing protein [candidate division KSB3 bacterium]MBD3322988.1 PDZ domain-containing protein [candidate division KSB3 bacterium]
MIKTIYQLSFEHNGHGGLRDQIVKVVEKTQASIVRFQAHIPEDRYSTKVLGAIRQGTGVVVNPQGYILTVGYLIMEATEIQVVLADERIVNAEVTGVDFESGLGLMRIVDPVEIEPITLGNASRVTPGQLTLTIGESTEAQARIITNGRIFDTALFIGYWEYLLERALYVVPQNPAFGGSPLFNIEGEVIGIISLQLNQHQGMNLAIPVEMLYDIENELIQYGRVMSRKPRTWTGMYHAPYEHGVIVVDVMPDAPAHQAGIQKGDIVTHIGQTRVKTEEQFLRQLWEIPIHTEFQIRVLRRDKPHAVTVRGIDFYEFYDVGGSSEFPGH